MKMDEILGRLKEKGVSPDAPSVTSLVKANQNTQFYSTPTSPIKSKRSVRDVVRSTKEMEKTAKQIDASYSVMSQAKDIGIAAGLGLLDALDVVTLGPVSRAMQGAFEGWVTPLAKNTQKIDLLNKSLAENLGGLGLALAEGAQRANEKTIKGLKSSPTDFEFSGKRFIQKALSPLIPEADQVAVVDNFKKFLKKNALASKLTAQTYEEAAGAFGKAMFGDAFSLVNVMAPKYSETIEPLSKAVGWLAEEGPGLAFEIVRDNLLLSIAGSAKPVVPLVTKALVSGANAGIAKASPDVLKTVFQSADEFGKSFAKTLDKAIGGDIVEKVWASSKKAYEAFNNGLSAISPAWGVKRAFSDPGLRQILGKDGAKIFINSVNDEMLKAGVKMDEIVDATRAFKSELPPSGWVSRSSNYGLTKKIKEGFLAGRIAKEQATEELNKALIKVSDNTAEAVSSSFLDQTNSVIGKLLDGKATDADISKIRGHLSAMTFRLQDPKYVPDMRKIFIETKNSIVGDVKNLAATRMQVFRDMDKAYDKAQGKVLSKARAAIGVEEKAFKSKIVSLRERAKKSVSSLIDTEDKRLLRELNQAIKSNDSIVDKVARDKANSEMYAVYGKLRKDAVKAANELVWNDTNTKINILTEEFGQKRASFLMQDGRYRFSKKQASERYKMMRTERKEMNQALNEVKKLNFTSMWNGMLEKQSEFFRGIREAEKAKLGSSVQKNAFDMYFDVLDEAYMAESAAAAKAGKPTTLYTPNYVARQAKGGPFLRINLEDVMPDVLRYGNSQGISKPTKDRSLRFWQGFIDWAKKNDAEVVDDMLTGMVYRVQQGKAKQALHNITASLPEGLFKAAQGGDKRAQKAVKAAKDYVSFVVNADQRVGDAFLKNKLLSAYTQTSKALMTLASPVYWANNVMGYPFMGLRAMGGKAFKPDHWMQGALTTVGFGDDVLLKNGLSGKIVKASELDNQFRELGLYHNRYSSNMGLENIKSGSGRGGNIFTRILSEGWRKAREIDDYARRSVAFGMFENGMGTAEEIVKKVRTELLDYTTHNRVDQVLNSTLAFYMYRRKTLEREFVNLITNPKRYATIKDIAARLGEGEPLSEEQRSQMSRYNKTTLNILGHWVNGIHQSYALGFTPFGDAYNLTYDLVNEGKFKNKILKTVANLSQQLDPGKKAVLEAVNYIRKGAEQLSSPVMEGRDFETSEGKLNPLLPKAYQALVRTEKGRNLLIDMSKKLGDPATFAERKYIEDGVWKKEKTLRIPRGLYDILSSGPMRFPKAMSEAATAYSNKTGIPLDEVTLPKLMESGVFTDADTGLKFLLGIRKVETDVEGEIYKAAVQREKIVEDYLKRQGVIKEKAFIPTKMKRKIKRGFLRTE